jgi:serine/threonine protein kinase
VNGPTLEERFARFVEQYEFHGSRLDPEALCDDRPELLWSLNALIDQYLRLAKRLEPTEPAGLPAAPVAAALPAFAGFRTIERIGAGGMGEVYKLHDVTLDRVVAAKVLRADARVPIGLATAFGEARAMALFSDPRFVQVFEFRADAKPPVIIMEYVDGFELGRIGPSLELRQRARVMKSVCEAMAHAHALGLVHRDLKPSNIMLDGTLNPKILDFGLASGSPHEGHFVGTPPYLAPEQLDASRSIDARTDVYALGVVLYELLCGEPPFRAADTAALLRVVQSGQPRLPVEVDPSVPEPLQAIALKAMERDPADRYQSAREMALDLARYLDGRPVLARPSQYASVLATRVRPHLEHIQEWLRLRLIYPHEAARLTASYRELDGREDDWIVASRALSYSQIALYLGALFLIGGSLFYFGAHTFYDAVHGVLGPFVVLAIPFAGLNLAAYTLARRDHRAVSVAFYLAGVVLLPLFLLILFHEADIFAVKPDAPGQIFSKGSPSNLQLQITILIACAWSFWLAFRTRTAALSTVFGLLLFLFALAVLGDYGLRTWVEKEEWDFLALHLMPLIAVYALAGIGSQRARPWFARPMFIAGVLVLIVSLELLALEGKLFTNYLGISLAPFQPAQVGDKTLLDTLAAMALNGVLFYLAGLALERAGSEAMRPGALLLFVVSPFAVLEPLGYLTKTGEYSQAYDWCYLAMALTAAVLSHQRQRRSFYYAGVLNASVAFWLIADHRKWFEKTEWAISLILVGLAILAGGFWLSHRERARSRPGMPVPDRAPSDRS